MQVDRVLINVAIKTKTRSKNKWSQGAGKDQAINKQHELGQARASRGDQKHHQEQG